MRVRTRLVLLLCLLVCGGCGQQKSTNELIADLKSPQERDRIIAVRLLPQRKGDAAKIVPALKKMNLLSDRQRQRFADLGILQFENWSDPFADNEQTASGAVSARLST